MQVLGKYDAIVAGGGLAGLTAATMLAQSGRRVRLLERSHGLGGRAATTVEGDVHLNLGPHAWYVGGPGTGVLARLGVELPGRPPKPRGYYAIRDGRLHTLPVGFVSLLTTDLFGLSGKLEVARMLGSLPRLEASRFDRVTLGDWLRRHIADPGARAYVEASIRVASYTNAPGVLSAGAGLQALGTALRDGVRYIDGGWQTIVDALERRADMAGVSIATSSPVAAVLHDGAVRGVRLASGEEIFAPAVVLAIDPSAAARLLEDLPSRVGRAWPEVTARAACLDLALARLPRAATTVAFGIDRPLYYSVHSAAAKLGPAGVAVIHAAKYLEPGDHGDSKDHERELEAMMDLLQPGWRAEVIARRYLPSLVVSHAVPTAETGGLPGRSAVDAAGIPGLFLAGDWVGAEGTLANAAVASAARAAHLALARTARVEAVA